MKRKFLLLFLMCILMGGVSSLFAQKTVTIDGTVGIWDKNANANAPLNANYTYTTSQQIYLKEELGIESGSVITKVAFNPKSIPSGAINLTRKIKVYMANTTANGFAEKKLVKMEATDLVFEGDFTIDGINKWIEIEFNKNTFKYDGGNILLCVWDYTNAKAGKTVSFNTYKGNNKDDNSKLIIRNIYKTGVSIDPTYTSTFTFSTPSSSYNALPQVQFTYTSGGLTIDKPVFSDVVSYYYPSNGITVLNPYFEFYADYVTDYKILASKDSEFTNITYIKGGKDSWVTKDINTKSVQTENIGNLDPGTTYYWKVLAKNVGVGIESEEVYSKTFTFTTEATAEPEQLESCSPASETVCYDGYPNLTWEYGANSAQYQLLLGNTEDLTEKNHLKVSWSTAGILGDSYQTSGLAVGTYYWQVNVKNGEYITKGEVHSFTIPEVENISNATADVNNKVLSWTFAKGTSQYKVLLGKATTENPEHPYEFLTQHQTDWMDATSENGTFTLPTNDIVAGATYYWAVDVKNYADQKIYFNMIKDRTPIKNENGIITGWEPAVYEHQVEVYSFVTSDMAAAENSSPKNNTGNLENPILKWNFNGNAAVEYRVFLGTDSENLTAVTEWLERETVATGLAGQGSYQTENLTAATKYFWRVDVRDANENEAEGTVWSFGTTLPKPVAYANPEQVMPSFDKYGGTTIQWNTIETAQGYNVYLGDTKLNTDLITNPTNYYVVDANSKKLEYNMVDGYDFYVEAVYELGSVKSEEPAKVKVSGKSSFSGIVYSNDYNTRLADATVTLTFVKDEFGRTADGTEYKYNTNSLGQLYVEQTMNGQTSQLTSFTHHNGVYDVIIEAKHHTTYTGSITIVNGGSSLAQILTPDQTVIFNVTLFNETFNKIDVYLENNNWEDAQPGYYNVYLKNGEKITNLGLKYFVVPDNMTTSVYFTYTGWRELGKGSYQFGVAKVEDKVNWSGVRKIDYDVFEVEGDWNTAANWRDGVPTADTAKVYLLAPATISAEEEVTAGTVNIEQGGSLTINGSLTAGEVYNNTQAGNLCINDGGQLRQNNQNLNGKFVMNISNDWSASNKGWQFISSPFIDATTASFESTEGDFDLYKYDGSKENEWVNYKNTGDDSGEEPELPEVGGKSEFSFDFEDGTLTGLRAFAGEGSNAPLWAVTNDGYYSNGTNVIYSASYDGKMTYASINNYIVTENAYAITAESKLSWYVRHTNYYAAYADVYEVVVSEDGETFTQIWSGTAETSVQEQELSLAEYAGKNLYIGFRHYCVDEYGGDALVLDNITLTTDSKTRNSNTRSFDEETFAQGVGYLASYEIQATATLVGTFNTKTSFDYKVSYTADKELANFHLLGNPFTFNMDWSKITAEGLVDGYAVVNNEGGYDYLTSGTINVGDGFFVKANAKNPSLSYDHSYVAPVLRGSEKANSINVIASGKAGKDNVVVNFAGQAEGFNKLQNFNDAIATVYVSENGKNYGIANVDENTTEVALNFDAKEMGSYTISLDVNGEFETVILVDRFTGVETDMLVENEYSFIASNDDNVNRFVIRLAQGSQLEAQSQFVYQSGEELILSIEGSVQIVDMLGRVVYSNEHASGNNRINVGEFNDATYVVRVVNEEGVKVQKVVIY